MKNSIRKTVNLFLILTIRYDSRIDPDGVYIDATRGQIQSQA